MKWISVKDKIYPWIEKTSGYFLLTDGKDYCLVKDGNVKMGFIFQPTYFLKLDEPLEKPE